MVQVHTTKRTIKPQRKFCMDKAVTILSHISFSLVIQHLLL